MNTQAALVERLRPDIKQVMTSKVQSSDFFYRRPLERELINQLKDRYNTVLQTDYRGVSLRNAVNEALKQVIPDLDFEGGWTFDLPRTEVYRRKGINNI
ncbi:MAG TPA: hypothetical protein VJJ52_00375 [Candidatus Nanoarchaeia archaeon]|nr:hypothetical protein [Candidatus Nanoarchaeia archaeon]